MLSTIGLNDGPYLVMTIAFENQCLILDDRIEARIPRLVLSADDTIAISDFLTSPPHKPNNGETFFELAELPVSLTVSASAYGKRYNIIFEQTVDGDTCTVESSEFSVKAWFTSYAESFFIDVLHATDHNTLFNSH